MLFFRFNFLKTSYLLGFNRIYDTLFYFKQHEKTSFNKVSEHV